MKSKVCRLCNRSFPATVEHFHRGRKNSDGFDSRCKECKGSSFGVKYINVVTKAEEGFKFCSKCKEQLPKDVNHFYNSSKSKDGFKAACKICAGGEYGVKIPNAVHKLKEGYKYCSKCLYEKSYEDFSLCSSSKDGRKSHCKKCTKKARSEYLSRPEVKLSKSIYNKKYNKAFYQTEHGKNVNKRNIQLRRSRKNSVFFHFSIQDWEDALEEFDNKCAYCGKESKLQQEHIIPLSKGGFYTKKNIIPACGFCNGSKHNRDIFEWYTKQSFFSDERMKKICKWSGIDGTTKTQQLSIL